MIQSSWAHKCPIYEYLLLYLLLYLMLSDILLNSTQIFWEKNRPGKNEKFDQTES